VKQPQPAPILKQATAPTLEQQSLQRKQQDAADNSKPKYDIQVKPINVDSGHNSSQTSSPSSSDKNIAVPLPSLESSKPRRPRSQFVKQTQGYSNPNANHRFSYQNQDYQKQNIQVPSTTDVYRADMVTYADLDPKAFMVPANKVLPTGSFSDSSSRSTYAEISVSRSKLV